VQKPNGEQAPQRPTPEGVSRPAFESARLLTSEGFRHAFFTRLGGVSAPPFDSLNVAAVSTGDSAESVAENVRRCAAALDVPEARLYFLSQVHGTKTHIVDGTEDREQVVRCEGDLVASKVSGVAPGVRSADCVPVLLADRRKGAVVAVHSGWRGTVANAVAAGVSALREIAPDASIIAAIGPHIEACCFEVGHDVALALAQASVEGDRVIDRSRGRPRVDLRRIVRAQLSRVGVDLSLVEDVRGCTVCDASRWYSFRRDAEKSGRLLSAIVAR
jgi:polyphenol oxidase